MLSRSQRPARPPGRPPPRWPRRHLRRERRLVLVRRATACAVALVAAAASATAPGPALGLGLPTTSSCAWQAPVDAKVIDGFRPPTHRYGPGNRGLEYGVARGDTVRAVADGHVGFVGPVGGRTYVVVEHGGSLRSTYGPVLEVTIVRGQRVAQGVTLAVAELGFHLTARVGDRYVDPQPLLDGRCGRARLVPVPSSRLTQRIAVGGDGRPTVQPRSTVPILRRSRAH